MSVWFAAFWFLTSIVYPSNATPIVLSTNNVSSADLLCPNVSSFDSCTIHCIHEQGAYERTIDCGDASICIININATLCASGSSTKWNTIYSTINATNAELLTINIDAQEALSYSNIYLPNNGSAYINAYKGSDMLAHTNIYANDTQNVIINCYDQQPFPGYNRDCSALSVYASGAHNLQITANNRTAMNNALIYCPENGFCSVDISAPGSQMSSSAIYSLQGIQSNDNNHTHGLRFACNADGNSCQRTVVACDPHYSTYSILDYANYNWNYGSCADSNRLVHYDANYSYVSTEKAGSSTVLQCIDGSMCIINCVHVSSYMTLACGNAKTCIINIVNECGTRATLLPQNTINLIVNVLQPDGKIWNGKVVVNDPSPTETIVFHCYARCDAMQFISEYSDTEYALINYLEINVYDGGTIGHSTIRCPQSSTVTPSCVVRCESMNADCSVVSYYALNGIPDLSISCNDSSASHCTSTAPQGVLCGPYGNITVPIQYNNTLQQWDYGLCYPPQSIQFNTTNTIATSNTIMDTTEYYPLGTSKTLFFSDFVYEIENVFADVFVLINQSIHSIEEAVEGLYDVNDDIEYDDVDIVNANHLSFTNNTLIIIVRVQYEIIYRTLIINYTLSSEYEREFIQEVRQQLNDTTITVTIVQYINQSTTPSPQDTSTPFTVDYTDQLLIAVVCVNAIACLFACIVWLCPCRTDSAKPSVLILLGLRLTDVITDVNVCYVLWKDYTQNKRDDVLLSVLCILSLLFLFVPWAINIYCISVIRKRMAKNRRTSLWFSNYANSTFFLLLVVVTGDAFFALQVIASSIFGIRRLDAGISEKLDMDQFRVIKVFGVVCCEDFPQLIIAAVYAFSIEQGNEDSFIVALLSMIISVISIFVCVVSWWLMRSASKQQSHAVIKYTIDLKLTAPSINKAEEKKSIMKQMGFKLKLRNDLSLIIGTEKEQMEIVYTSITSQGAHVDVVHFIHDTEMQMLLSSERTKTMNVNAFITNIYNDNETQTNGVLKEHYGLRWSVTHKILFPRPQEGTNAEQKELHTEMGPVTDKIVERSSPTVEDPSLSLTH
eukprot:223491_1